MYRVLLALFFVLFLGSTPLYAQLFPPQGEVPGLDDMPPYRSPQDYAEQASQMAIEELIEQLATPIVSKWRAIRNELVVRADEAFPLLEEALDHESVRHAGRAIEVFQAIGGDRVIPLLPKFSNMLLRDSFIVGRALDILGAFSEHSVFAIPDMLYAQLWYQATYNISFRTQTAISSILPEEQLPLVQLGIIYSRMLNNTIWRDTPIVERVWSHGDFILPYYQELLRRSLDEEWNYERKTALEYGFMIFRARGARLLATGCDNEYEIQNITVLARTMHWCPDLFEIDALCAEYGYPLYEELALAGDPYGISLWLIRHIVISYGPFADRPWSNGNYQEGWTNVRRIVVHYPDEPFFETAYGPTLPGMLDTDFRAQLILNLASAHITTDCFTEEELENVRIVAIGVLGTFGTTAELDLLEETMQDPVTFRASMEAWPYLAYEQALEQRFVSILSDAYANERLDVDIQDYLLSLLIEKRDPLISLTYEPLAAIKDYVLGLIEDMYDLNISADDQIAQYTKICAAITIFCEEYQEDILEDFMMELELSTFSNFEGAYYVLDIAISHWKDRDALLEELRALYRALEEENAPEMAHLLEALSEIFRE